MEIAPRITAEPDKLGGKPCIRGLRFPVSELLGLLSVGMTAQEIVIDYPDLEVEDIPAALEYAQVRMLEPVVWAADRVAAE